MSKNEMLKSEIACSYHIAKNIKDWRTNGEQRGLVISLLSCSLTIIHIVRETYENQIEAQKILC